MIDLKIGMQRNKSLETYANEPSNHVDVWNGMLLQMDTCPDDHAKRMELKLQTWEVGYGTAGLFVHRKFIVGSTPSNPINLKEGVKARWVSPFCDQCLPLHGFPCGR